MENNNKIKKLYRSKTNKVISGICGGLGEYFDIDPVIFRILFILLALSGIGVLLYIILIFVIPLEGKENNLDSDHLKESLKESAGELKDDAHDLANKLKSEESWFKERRNVFAMLVILVGLIALLKQIVPIPWLGFHLVWPLIIIFIGLLIISKK